MALLKRSSSAAFGIQCPQYSQYHFSISTAKPTTSICTENIEKYFSIPNTALHHHLNWAFVSIHLTDGPVYPNHEAGGGGESDWIYSYRGRRRHQNPWNRQQKDKQDIFGRKLVNKLFAGYELKVEKTTGTIDSALL